MPQSLESPNAGIASNNDIQKEKQLSWPGGSLIMRTVRLEHSSANLVRDDLAVGIILFAEPGGELTWRLDGRTLLNKTWTSRSGSHDLIVLPPGCELYDRFRGVGQGLWIFLDPETVAESSQVKAFAEKPTVDASWSQNKLAWSVISELKKECVAGFPRGPLFLENAATMFVTQLTYLLGDAAPRFEPTRALSDSKLRTVIDYFESNLHRNVTLSELSSLVDLTPRYFCAAFKQATGRPPHQFQIERRVERAKTLLLDEQLTLANVALMVGFSSQSHLNGCFRRIIGVTPARYRAEVLPRGPLLHESRWTL